MVRGVKHDRNSGSKNTKSACGALPSCILVIEDDPLVVQVIEDILDSIGFEVITAQTASQAVSLYRDNCSATSCIILDYGIPGMHVSRLLSELKEINSDVKVLLSSGYPQSFISRDVCFEGIDGFIAKPYDPQHLVTELNKIIA